MKAYNNNIVGTSHFQVPDRGGRPSNVAPPIEMPSFKKRTDAPRDQRPSHRDSGNFVKTFKICVKLILNCPRAHITFSCTVPNYGVVTLPC